jgi:hypothetical protein
MPRLVRALGAVPYVRAAAFRQSATPAGVEGLAAVATSGTAAATLTGLSFNGLDGVAASARCLLLDAQKGFAFVVDCTQAKEFALAHWLVNGTDGGRLFVCCFGGDGAVRENVAGDVLASLTTTLWNVPFKVWTGGATMADATLNRRMAVRLGPGVTFAQIGIFGFNGQIDFEALRPYGPPEKTPAGHRQAAHLSQRLRAEGVPMFDFRTTTQNLAPAINELDAAMRSSRLRHDGNPVLGWCVGNVVGRPDRRGNPTPPSSGRSRRSTPRSR